MVSRMMYKATAPNKVFQVRTTKLTGTVKSEPALSGKD